MYSFLSFELLFLIILYITYVLRNCQVFFALYVYNISMLSIKFGERLKELRLDRNLKQKDIAKEMHVSTPTVTRWERGVQEPDFLTLALLASYFKVTTDYLLGIEE